MLGKLGERGDAPGDDLGIGRHPVVRNAVPGWEAQALHFGREELKRVFERREPLTVAGDMQDRLARLAAREMARKRAEHRGVEPFGHAACDRRAAGRAAARRAGFQVSTFRPWTVVSSF